MQVLPQDLPVPSPNRFTESFDLTPHVVNIIFLRNPISHHSQETSENVSRDCSAAVTNVKGAGGVGANKFHLNSLAMPDLPRAILRPLPLNLSEQRDPCRLLNEKVDETRACNLHAIDDPFRIPDFPHNRLSHIPGVRACSRSEYHSDIGGIVSVTTNFWNLQYNRRYPPPVDSSPLQGSLNSRCQDTLQDLFHSQPASFSLSGSPNPARRIPANQSQT